MVSLLMTVSDPWPGFQGHGSFKRRVGVYPKRHILQTQLLYRTLIRNRSTLSLGKLAIQLRTPLLLRKPYKLFASVARVCQRQLAFLVMLTLANFDRFLPRDARSASAVLLSQVVRPWRWGTVGIRWTSWKVITRIIIQGSSLLGATTSVI